MIAYIILFNAVAVWVLIRHVELDDSEHDLLSDDTRRSSWNIARGRWSIGFSRSRIGIGKYDEFFGGCGRRLAYYLLYYLFAFLFFWNGDFGIAYAVLLLVIPFGIRLVMKIKEEREIENGIVGFLGCLNSRLMVDNDIVTALENTQHIVPTKGIRRLLREFSVALTISCNPTLAFEKMRGIHNSYLRYVFINLQNVLDSWGEARELVRELENEYISVQIEINKGRVELQNDKVMTYLGLGLTAITAFNIVGNDAAMMSFYAERPWLVVFLGGLAFSGVVVLFTTKLS